MKTIVLRKDWVERLSHWLSEQVPDNWSSLSLSPDGSYLAGLRSSGGPDFDGVWIVSANDLQARQFATVKGFASQVQDQVQVLFSSAQ